MDKPDCYKCKYRGNLPGSCHSCCKHPSNAAILDDPLAQIIGIFGSVKRGPGLTVKTKLNVKGNPHGIKNGWFNWPVNFDPVWLEKCDGFEPKNNDRITPQGDKTS